MDLLHAFKQRLEEHNELLAVGYSFRDEHINEVISKWFNKSVIRKIVVIDREEATPCDNDFYRQYHGSLGNRCEWHNVGAEFGIRNFLQADAWQ